MVHLPSRQTGAHQSLTSNPTFEEHAGAQPHNAIPLLRIVIIIAFVCCRHADVQILLVCHVFKPLLVLHQSHQSERATSLLKGGPAISDRVRGDS